MCGIAGKISFTDKCISDKEMELMGNVLAHRGPDDSGVYISPNKNVGLAHRRLAIIDLSSAAHQPMRYRDRYRIVFNGEIYNFLEQREILKNEGCHFVSRSDAEVILALYDKYKERCLEYLRGMFAFAIYDEQENVLFCARDRVGKKPFKYYSDGLVFMFASELKAILTQPEYKKEPDYTAIHHYLTLQYVPAPLTGFVGIKKLGAGEYLKLDVRTGKQEVRRYWKLDYSRKLRFSEDEWEQRILAKLEESVKLRMIADVPLGAFLSGGVDSSAIVAMMSKVSSRPIKTFSIGFEEQKYNELPYAKKIANLFDTDHTEFIIKPNAIEMLPMLVKQYEEPYADSSALATYHLSKLTRKHVTVALNGDGGDENFAGYPWYSVQKFAAWYEKMSTINNITVLPVSALLLKVFKNTFFERAHRFSCSVSEDYAYRYANYICYFTNEMKKYMYTADFSERMKGDDSHDILSQKFKESCTPDRIDQTLYTDIVTYLPDDLLVKVDIASMAVALEGRSPFLDHEFMELTSTIPSKLKLKGVNTKKYILKKALERCIPSEILHRKKMGFGIPIEAWFRGDLQEYLSSNIVKGNARIHNIIRKEYVQNMHEEHVKTNMNHSNRLWALLTLELWFREYFG